MVIFPQDGLVHALIHRSAAVMVIFPQDGLVHALIHRSGAVEAEHHGRPLEGAAHPVRGSILLLVGALGVAATLP